MSSFDKASNRLITDIIGNVKIDGKKISISEQHIQNAFDMKSIETCLYDAGFIKIHPFCLPDFTLPTGKEKRLYYCAFKANSFK